MELWFIYAILSAVFAGLYHFSVKSAAEFNHDSSQSTYYSMISAALISLILFILNPRVENLVFVVSFGILNSFFYFLSTAARIDSLKYVQATFYYPFYKIVNSILVFLAGAFLFNDILDLRQLIGIFIGVATLMLLAQKKETKIQKNIKKGLVYLAISVVGGVLSAIVGKYISISSSNVYAFIFISCTFMVAHGVNRYKKTRHKTHSIKYVKRISFLGGIASFLSYLFFLSSMKGSPFIIAYTINSFSIIIVTLLSVIVYKDHLDKRKGLALILTFISLILLR